jgi:hypothetical protein
MQSLLLGIYLSFFSYLENFSSRFLLYLIYIYSYISHQNSWQITWPIPGPSYNGFKSNSLTYFRESSARKLLSFKDLKRVSEP